MNEAITNVALIVASTPSIVFADPKKADELFAHIEHEIAEFKPDLTTDKGRKAIASLAYKVAQTKTAIDAAGAQLNEDANKKIAVVNAERRKFKDRLDTLRDLARKPLTEWETAEAQRKQAMDAILNRIGLATIITVSDTTEIIAARLAEVQAETITAEVFQDALETAEGHQRKAVESLARSLERSKQADADRAELQRLRDEQAERDRQQAAAEASRRETEVAANRERIEAERHAQAAADEQLHIEQAAEDARLEAERKAADERAATERQHAEQLAAAERETQRVRDEQARKDAEADRIAKEDAARAADMKHRGDVMRAAKEALMKVAGIGEPKAKQIVLAILANQIPNVSVRF